MMTMIEFSLIFDVDYTGEVQMSIRRTSGMCGGSMRPSSIPLEDFKEICRIANADILWESFVQSLRDNIFERIEGNDRCQESLAKDKENLQKKLEDLARLVGEDETSTGA